MGKIELIGAEILTAKMLTLPQDIRVAVEKTALKEANEILVDALKQGAAGHYDTGALKSSFTHDIRKCKGDNVVMGRVGVDYNVVGTVVRNKQGNKQFKKTKNATGNKRRPAKYFHIVNLGTKDRKTKAGHNRGNVAKSGFREDVLAKWTPLIQRLFERAAEEALKKWNDENLPF